MPLCARGECVPRTTNAWKKCTQSDRSS